MSLLDAANEDILVFPEEAYTDADGNTLTRAGRTGVPARARIAPASWAGRGDSADRASEGFESEQIYLLRFPRSWRTVLGAQSQIEWRGVRWSIFGDPVVFNSSPATAHSRYMIRRS
ncbi:hypothetical protein [Segniliparus rugosus]|uniref:Head-to-tail stopper n=1 Tax=Segniliparus rugosus (strain ATCC BAA-974 / DSM 45345 / CCUG 50838 / CIP 108380 / JCM 13579 / CDC 945) TaxID=679197 RepID=E5XRT1_SEGRC|nr:hypothetical protein [Segniliparus rugosus]EFV12946.1 hypothetical protein HMPREF9336_02203 [Segniliparus rugosus ATCC BAA-974]